MDNVKATIEKNDGTISEVEILTYLKSTDGLTDYAIYHQGEVQGVEEDHVIYISKMKEVGGILQIEEITNNAEWMDVVQNLLRPIANKK